jgi:hypothetical protein
VSGCSGVGVSRVPQVVQVCVAGSLGKGRGVSVIVSSRVWVALDRMEGVLSFGMTGWVLLVLGALGSLLVSTLILVKLLDVVRGRGRSPHSPSARSRFVAGRGRDSESMPRELGPYLGR